MAQEDLAIRFSDKIYATKNDVSRILKISQIDTIWSSVLNYRSHFTRSLELRNIEKTPFNLVMTPTLTTRVNAIERKLTKIMVRYSRLHDNDLTKFEIKRTAYRKNLRVIANKYHLDVTDDFITSLAMNTLSSIAPQDMILEHYINALKFIEKYYSDPLDEDYLIRLYSIVSGNEEIVSLYRTDDLAGVGSKAIIDRVYNAAPVERIAEMMTNMLTFINDDNLSFFIRGLCAFYFIQYVKPFDCYSEEIGLLFMKGVMSHDELEDLASLLLLENLLENEEENSNVFHEVQKTNDMTYLLVYTLDKIESSIDQLFAIILESDADSIKHEFFKEEPPEEVVSSMQEVTREAPSTLSEHVNYEVKVALPVMPTGLDEKDAQRIEESLLELNPNLKKGEAYFYARHCTIGKFYTIQQYKKVLDCAYETARTSMDRLVFEGFYRKEMVKNKFVYTPIPRK